MDIELFNCTKVNRNKLLCLRMSQTRTLLQSWDNVCVDRAN